jgi:hypothetical protein
MVRPNQFFAVPERAIAVLVPIRSDLSNLAPTSCEGAARFNAMACCCCVLFVGPLAILLPLGLRASSSAAALPFYVVTGVLSGLVFLVCCCESASRMTD